MRPLPVLIAACAAFTLIASLWGGPDSGPALIGACAVIAAVLLALQSWLRGGAAPRTGRRTGQAIVIDGSNLLYWRHDTPDIRSVAKVLRLLEAKGYAPRVWFDANVGYLISNRYLNPAELASMLKIDPKDVRIAPKGEQADPLLLAAAQRHGLPILSNDRFRDRQDAFPFITEPGRLLRGKLVKDELTLQPAYPARAEARPAASVPPLPGERRPGTAVPAQKPAAQRPQPRREPQPPAPRA